MIPSLRGSKATEAIHNIKFEGRGDNGRLVHIKSANPLKIGEIYSAKITSAKNGALFGEVV